MEPLFERLSDLVNANPETVLLEMIEDLHSGMLLSSRGFTGMRYAQWDSLAAIGVNHALTIPFKALDANSIRQIDEFLGQQYGWCFFAISYDFRCVFENQVAGNPDRIGFPELILFHPQAVIGKKNGQWHASGDLGLIDSFVRRATRKLCDDTLKPAAKEMRIHATMGRADYFNGLAGIRHHIQQGDIYEMNFCREFFGDVPSDFDPSALFLRLSAISPAPFSAYCRWDDHALVSASPERFLQKNGGLIISQPMKGTIRRGVTVEEDHYLLQRLKQDEKERSENVMIADLVRNDLSRIALPGSVVPVELFGIYTFPFVHQMISTISAKVPVDIPFTRILKATFPMGSMTGAPKIRAMDLIEHFEFSRRGIFSGAVGYISPDNHMDMNVVIRSIVCNTSTSVVSFQTGGAITSGSDPEGEYSETMLKAKALAKALNATGL